MSLRVGFLFFYKFVRTFLYRVSQINCSKGLQKNIDFAFPYPHYLIIQRKKRIKLSKLSLKEQHAGGR